MVIICGCPSCNDRDFDNSDKLPKILACGHTFCLACLNILLKSKKIICPICKEKTVPQKGDVRRLITNKIVLEEPHTFDKSPNRCVNVENENGGMKEITADVIYQVTKTWDKLMSKIQTRQQADIKKDGGQPSHTEDLTENKEIVNREKRSLFQCLENPIAEIEKHLKHFLTKLGHDTDGTDEESDEHIYEAILEIHQENSQADMRPNQEKKRGHLELVPDQYLTTEQAKRHHTQYQCKAIFKFTPAFGTDTPPLPCNIAVSSVDGDILVTDVNYYLIHQFNKDLELYCSIGPVTFQQRPSGVAWTKEKTIITSDVIGHKIRIRTAKGKLLKSFGEHGNAEDEFDNPLCIAIDAEDYVFICDSNNGRIQVVNLMGMHVCSFAGFFKPQFIAVSVSDDIAVVSCDEGNIHIFTSMGHFQRKIAAGKPNSFKKATGVAIDQLGNIVVADYEGYVYILSQHGEVRFRFGSPGDRSGELSKPLGIALTHDNGLVVCESGNQRLQLFKCVSQPKLYENVMS